MIEMTKDMLEKNFNNLYFVNKIKEKQKQRDNFCKTTRPLRKEEIEILQRQGNFAEDWSLVKVKEDFIPYNIRNNWFWGKCFLGIYTGKTIEGVDAISVKTGIYNSLLKDTVIEDECYVLNVNYLNNYFIEKNSLLFNIGTLSASPINFFGNNRKIVVGIECGGREIFSFADISFEDACRMSLKREKIEEYCKFIEEYTDKIKSNLGIVCKESQIYNCPRILSSFFDEYSRCINVTYIDNVTILSSKEEPTYIENGAYIKNSIIQWGCYVGSMAIVDESVLIEHSHVERHGKVTHSIIGPNSGIAEGEVTSSLVGPFVGFHHQALLIGTLWPQGKGNVAYGANVGSNHTSKAPDQELYCGEGIFFGLGVNIKFPADLSKAPYTIIATGVTTLPQKVTFPFSLINVPSSTIDGIPLSWNEIFPGWVLYENLYMIKRNEAKYLLRNKSKRNIFPFEIFRPEIIDLIVEARNRLCEVKEKKDIYTEKEIDGIGKNFMAHQSLLKGIDAYNFIIEKYSLTTLFLYCKELLVKKEYINEADILSSSISHLKWQHAKELYVNENFSKRSLKENLLRLCELIDIEEKMVILSKEKDDIRGKKLIEDYEATHTSVIKDKFIIEMKLQNQKIKKEIEEIIPFVR